MRIVSLCPSLTELVFDLGHGDDLVGVTKFCIHPAEGVASIEKVGGTKNPRVERIAELAPDIVLLNAEENRIEDSEALRGRAIPCHVSFPKTAAETAKMVRSIGAAIGAAPEAERIAVEIENGARRVRDQAEGTDVVSYAYLIWRDPVMAAGTDTFISDLLGLAGGVNVFDASSGFNDRYPTVGIEGLADANPEVVFLSTEPFPFRERHADELSAATGIPRHRFRIVDGELLSWQGSRTPRGIEYAGSILDEIRKSKETTHDESKGR
ncbi:MAG: helical backbone metal receptor [marine benthic group bacterium]|nr:helical backbone metal receptor [Gemmatimonadota bacterium]